MEHVPRQHFTSLGSQLRGGIMVGQTVLHLGRIHSHGSWSLTFQFPIIRSYRVLMYYPGGIDYKEWSRITSNLVVRVTLVLSPPSSVDQP